MPKRKNKKDGEAFQKTLTLALLSVVSIVVIIGLIVLSNPIISHKIDNLSSANSAATKVHFIDVGQGDAVLIEQSGEFALIDAGEKSTQQQLNNYLDKSGVKDLKYLIMTHPHQDHIGGMSGVIDKFNVGKIILPDFEKAPMPTSVTFEKLLDKIAEKGIAAETANVGAQYTLGNGKITVLANGIKTDNYNNLSLATMFETEGMRYFSTGDGEKELENEILHSNLNISANVFKAAHHGSKTSNTNLFISGINPDFVIVSCGKDNSYGHPHKEALASFANARAEVLRTDERGAIIAYVDENGECKIAAER